MDFIYNNLKEMKMNIYVAKREDADYEEYDGFTLVAKDLDEAKALVNKFISRESYLDEFKYELIGTYTGSRTKAFTALESNVGS